MKFNVKITWTIGLTTKHGQPYAEQIAIEAARDRLARAGFDAFTVVQARGYWKGTPEDSLIVSVLVPDDLASLDPAPFARFTAYSLARDLEQEAVLWAVERLDGGLSYS